MEKTGFFYIVKNKIFYFIDREGGENYGHSDLWQAIVPKILPDISFEERQDIKNSAIYGTDRGRVTKNEAGIIQVFGTHGCEGHLGKLKSIFNLDSEKLKTNLKVDFSSDPHYKINDRDQRLLYEYLASRVFDSIPFEITKITKYFK